MVEEVIEDEGSWDDCEEVVEYEGSWDDGEEVVEEKELMAMIR